MSGGSSRRRISSVDELAGAGTARIDDFVRYGTWLNVAAAMGGYAHQKLVAWASSELAARAQDAVRIAQVTAEAQTAHSDDAERST